MTAPAEIVRPGVLALYDPETLGVQKVILYCQDCGSQKGKHLDFWATDEVWTELGNPQGVLCLDCLRRRLGRPLTQLDFTTRGISLHKGIPSWTDGYRRPQLSLLEDINYLFE